MTTHRITATTLTTASKSCAGRDADETRVSDGAKVSSTYELDSVTGQWRVRRTRRLAMRAAGIVSLLACSLSAGCVATSATSDDPGAVEGASALASFPESIRLARTDLCIDRAYGGVDPSTEIILYKCHGHGNQLWTRRFGLLAFDTSNARVMPEITERCLTAGTFSPVGIMPCHLLSTRWAFENGSLTSGGKCLTATTASPSARLTLSACNSSALQTWELIDGR